MLLPGVAAADPSSSTTDSHAIHGRHRNLNGRGWNDRISSIRVYGRARIEVYRDADYRGQRLRIERDSADLGAINWSDQISSFQVR